MIHRNYFLENKVGYIEGDCQKLRSQNSQSYFSVRVVVPGLDWPEDYNTAVHGNEGQKKDTGQKVKNRHGAVELTEQLAKEPVVVRSQQDELEKQQEDDGKVSHGQVEVPYRVDCAGHVEAGHSDDEAIASQT